MLSSVWLFMTPTPVARQTSLSMGFPRQEYWSGLPHSRASSQLRDWTLISCISWMKNLQADSSPTGPQGKTHRSGIKSFRVQLFIFSLHILLFLCSVQFSHSVVYNSLRPHGLQHATLPCPLTTLLKLTSTESVMPSNHLILSVPFSSHLQSFPTSASFLMSQFFTSGGQSIGASASASVLSTNIQDWFPLGWTGLILQSKGLSRVFSNTTVQKHQFFSTQLSL